MTRTPPVRCLAPWLRTVGWLIAVLWVFGAAGFVFRWWLMKRAHERVALYTGSIPRPPSSITAMGAAGTAATGEPEVTSDESRRATPVRDLPLIGPVLKGDADAIRAWKHQTKELNAFGKWLGNCRIDGTLSFRKFLEQLGVEGAANLSEAEAAAEFLRRLDALGDFLPEWRRALDLGPWDFTGVNLFEPVDPLLAEPPSMLVWRTGTLAQRLWGAATEAAWRTGDSAAAWQSWQSMVLNAERTGDVATLLGGLAQDDGRLRFLDTLQAGILLGGWTDDQLAALPAQLGSISALESMRHSLDGEKRQVEILFNQLASGEGPLADAMLSPLNSPTTQWLNRLALGLSTSQQMADNLAVIQASRDRALERFDPVTGILLPASTAAGPQVNDLSHSGSWFDRFYFQYAQAMGNVEHSIANLPGRIVHVQSSLDQARLAAALEAWRRANGSYPDSLASVAPAFPDGVPRDIATGGPFRYEKNDDGRFTLWGAGFDQHDNGGDPAHDVVWASKPVRPDH